MEQADKIRPIGRLQKYQSDIDNLYVKPCNTNRRRKYVDTVGNIFISIFGQWWKFPEEVEY